MNIIFSILFLFTVFTALILKDIIPLIFLSGFYLIFIRFLPLHQAKKQYQQLKMYQDKMVLKTSADGLHFEHIMGSSFVKWEAFIRYQCEPSLCILYASSVGVHIIPLSEFTEQQKLEFHILLKNKIPETL